MAKVSVIVPIYNVENYLKKCVDSILNQTYADLEIILVDDGATDLCPAICDDYAEKDPRVKVVHKQNGGLGDARNAGLEVSTGDYILFVDSDDYIALDTVEILMKRASEFDADMVLFDYVSVDDDGNEFYRYTADLPKERIINPQNEKEVLTFTPSAVMRLYKSGIFKDTDFRFIPREWYEDLRLIPKLYSICSRIVYVDCEPLYFYLRRDNSIMRNGNIERVKTQRIEAVADDVAYYKEKGIYEQYKQELDWMWIFHGFLLPAREILHFKGDYSSAIKELRVAMIKNVGNPMKNKYITTIPKKEQIILKCIYYKFYHILRVMLKLREGNRFD